MKRKLMMLASGALCLCLLSGCGQAEQTDESSGLADEMYPSVSETMGTTTEVSTTTTTGAEQTEALTIKKTESSTTASTEAPTQEVIRTYSFGDSFDFDGYQGKLNITIGENYSFDTVNNPYADTNGREVIRIPLVIKNIDNKTAGLDSMDITIYDSNGRETSESQSILFNENIHAKMRPNASISVGLYILYSGDGDYYIQIYDSPIEIKLPIVK